MYEQMYKRAKELNADMLKTPYYEYRDEVKCGNKVVCNYAKVVTKTCPSDKVFSILDYPFQMSVHASLWSGIYKREWMNKANIRFITGKGAGYVDVGFRIDTFMNTTKAAWLNIPFYNYRLTNQDSSTNTFHIRPMLKRWNEAHKLFEKKYTGKYSKVGPYLFLDEFLNTISYIGKVDFTEEDFFLLKSNLNYVDETIIKNSPVMSEEQKKISIAVKNVKTFEEFKKLAINNIPWKGYRIKLFNLIPVLKIYKKTNKLYFNVFDSIPLFTIKIK